MYTDRTLSDQNNVGGAMKYAADSILNPYYDKHIKNLPHMRIDYGKI